MAVFGDILSSLSIGASQSIRRNSGNSAFEAYTPPGGVAGSNTQVQYNNSGAFGASAQLTIANTGTATKTSLNLNFGSGYSVNAQNRLDFDTSCRIAADYAVSQGYDGLWLKFYTGSDLTNQAFSLRADKQAVFAGHVELASGKTLNVGGTQFRGYTTSGGAATTTELPNDKDWSFHNDTGAAEKSICINISGTIYGIVMPTV
jgi:hypothetical protein